MWKRILFLPILTGDWLALFAQPAAPPQPPPPDPATVAFAERLDSAATEADRSALLDANPGMVTADLFRACLDRGQQFSARYSFDAALRSDQSALSVALRMNEPLQNARAYRAIGLVYYKTGQLPEALQQYQLGLDAARAAGNKKAQAEILRSIGVSQRGLANHGEAFTADEQALALYKEIGDPMGVVATTSGMGASYAHIGSLHKAMELFEQCEKLGESISSKTAIYKAKENIGALYVMQGDIPLGLNYIEQALAIASQPDSGANKREMADLYLNLIPPYRMAGRLEDALKAARHALELSQEGDIEIDAGYAHLNRGAVYRAQHHYQEAIADQMQALAIFEKQKTPREIADTLADLATVELDLNHNQEALKFALGGVELARDHSLPDILWKALQCAALAYQRLNQTENARAAYQEGVVVVDNLRRQLAGGEQEGMEFLRDKMNLFHGLMALDLAAGRNEDAFRVSERAKAGLILDVLRAGRADITKAMTDAEKQKETRLAARLSFLETRPERDSAAVHKAVHDLEEFRSELYAVHPELKLRRGESEPMSLASAGELLPDTGTALLEFAVTPEASYLFAITRGSQGKPALHVYKLPYAEDALSREVEAFREELATRSLGYRAPAAALYQKLLGPAADLLRDKSLLAIVPDGPLWSLPFQALVDPAGRHLIESSAMFYAPSLTVLLESGRISHSHSKGAKTLLAMGDPELGKQQQDLARLPNAANEVAAIGRLYGRGSVALSGKAATKAQWQALAPQYQVVHLATHGKLNSDNPLYSYVLLRAGRSDNGLVEAREILDLDLNADLVVLSACETGRGGFRYGEGLVGMNWALMVAGSSASVVSQWKVDSASTTDLMLALHQELRGKLSGKIAGKAAAFRTASLRLLQAGAYRHPYYWAGFVMVGDGY